LKTRFLGLTFSGSNGYNISFWPIDTGCALLGLVNQPSIAPLMATVPSAGDFYNSAALQAWFGKPNPMDRMGPNRTAGPLPRCEAAAEALPGHTQVITLSEMLNSHPKDSPLFKAFARVLKPQRKHPLIPWIVTERDVHRHLSHGLSACRRGRVLFFIHHPRGGGEKRLFALLPPYRGLLALTTASASLAAGRVKQVQLAALPAINRPTRTHRNDRKTPAELIANGRITDVIAVLIGIGHGNFQ
jgi:hypothetical protein